MPICDAGKKRREDTKMKSQLSFTKTLISYSGKSGLLTSKSFFFSGLKEMLTNASNPVYYTHKTFLKPK